MDTATLQTQRETDLENKVRELELEYYIKLRELYIAEKNHYVKTQHFNKAVEVREKEWEIEAKIKALKEVK